MVTATRISPKSASDFPIIPNVIKPRIIGTSAHTTPDSRTGIKKMTYFDHHPNQFRLFFATFLVLCLAFGSMNTYQHTTRFHDENWYNTAPSQVRINPELANPDTLPEKLTPGNLVIAINTTRVDSLADIHRILPTLPEKQPVTLGMFDPVAMQRQFARIDQPALADSLFVQIPQAAMVIDVMEGGASSRAGVKPGDLIVRIDGKHFDDAFEADHIMQQAGRKGGGTVQYDILRDNNQHLTLNVTLVRFGITFELISLVICGLLYIGVGSFIALKRPHIHGARLVGSSLTAIGYVLMVAVQAKYESAFMLNMHRASVGLCMVAGPAIWFDSWNYFPRERPDLLQKHYLRALIYIIPALGVLTALIIKDDRVIFLSLLLVAGYYSVIHYMHSKSLTREYIKLGRIIWWTLIAIILISIAVPIALLRSPGNMQYARYLVFFWALLPLVYLYTIGRYQLFDLDLRVRRNIQYTIASGIWKVAILAGLIWFLLKLPEWHLSIPNIRFTGTLIEISEEPLPPEQVLIYEKIALMILAIGATYLAWRITLWGQLFIDQKYYRERYDYSRAANELANVMSNKLSMVDLARGLVQKLAEMLRLKRVAVIFIRKDHILSCLDAHGLDTEMWHSFCDRNFKALLKAMERFTTDSRLTVDYLPHELKQKFQPLGFRHIIPIRSNNNLVGMLFVGEKLSESPLNQDDLQFLSSIAKSASISIENAFLYERLAGQERLKHELEIARRIQLGSLPQKTPYIDGLDIAGVSIPALEVGGDYFDYLNGRPNNITVIVGDVSGKGTSAALYMSKVQGILHSLNDFDLSPRQLFIRANKILSHDMEKSSFVTAIGAWFDSGTRRIVFSRAGHLPLYYYQAASQTVREVTPRGLGLALDRTDEFASRLEEEVLEYQTGDTFLFVTDGITEAKNGTAEEFGEDNLMRLLTKNVHQPAHLIRDTIIDAVQTFSGKESHQHDDLTVVVVKAI